MAAAAATAEAGRAVRIPNAPIPVMLGGGVIPYGDVLAISSFITKGQITSDDRRDGG